MIKWWPKFWGHSQQGDKHGILHPILGPTALEEELVKVETKRRRLRNENIALTERAHVVATQHIQKSKDVRGTVRGLLKRMSQHDDGFDQHLSA